MEPRGCNPWQSAANQPRNRKNKRNPLLSAATGCLAKYMVSRASAVGCHPLREVPSLRGRRSISLKRQVLRTRRPTGLDRTTLTGERRLVNRNRRLQADRVSRSTSAGSVACADSAGSAVAAQLPRSLSASSEREPGSAA